MLAVCPECVIIIKTQQQKGNRMYHTVTNPIIRSGLFLTPISYAELDQIIQSLPEKEQALAYRISMITSNLCNKLVNQDRLTVETTNT
jgi:hypothetical protein